MTADVTRISGWGRYPAHQVNCYPMGRIDQIAACIAETKNLCIARGLGRGYGDVAIGEEVTLLLTGLNKVESIDVDKGSVIAQGGCSLAQLIEVLRPHGLFPYVTPGTKYVTVAGMIAADVHGKNHHHDGSFGHYIDWIDLVDHTGVLRRLSPQTDQEWFRWTIGGMGLTGVIVRVQFRVRTVASGWICQRTQSADGLSEVMQSLSSRSCPAYSVAWLDSTARGSAKGRAVIFEGWHAEALEVSDGVVLFPSTEQQSITVPRMPVSLVNRSTSRLFNALYYWRGQSPKKSLVDWNQYFYPLDKLNSWYRLYGSQGFTQFQVVLPDGNAQEAISELLDQLESARMGSPLAVLKRMGKEGAGLSFPKPGYTLTLDIPVTQRTAGLLHDLIEISIRYGGRFYLAKDAYLTADQLHRSDPRASQFREYRKQTGLDQVFQSKLSRRVEL